MMLYVFDCDVLGKSMCDGMCVVNWLFVFVDVYDKVLGVLSFVVCDDGKK